MPKKQRVSEKEQPSLQVTLPQQVQVKRQTVTNPNLLTLYANGFQIAVGPLDVRLFVMESVPFSDNEIQDRQIASIIMSPETLKLLADSIGSFVRIYEDNFGKIRELKIQRGAIKTIQAPLQT